MTWGRFWHRQLGLPFRLAYQRIGHSKPTVVLIHGIASDGSFWKPLIAELKADYTVIVPDLLGHGGSPTPDYIAYSTADQAKAVAALLRQLRIRQAIVVGHSMGALVAARLATEHPSLVRRLVLYEPPLFADVPEFKTHSRRRKFYFQIFEKIAENPQGTLTITRVVARIARNWTKFLQSEQTWLPIERSLRNTIMNQTAYEELRNIAIATDIVHGRLDMVVTRSGLKRMLGRNKNISFYKTTDNHGLSRASARYLRRLIASAPDSRDTSKA